ncbi:MAG: NADH-quinone oxidoreductase subunit A [Deltaproteobacteria bacterium]|nr:NADH-quinone oxidoreductase subunit A [Deltaproteobacteria bacterium]
MDQGYAGVAFMMVLGMLVAGGMLAMAIFIGPSKPSKVKGAPFECGTESVGTTRQRFSVRFYLVALLFIVFDIEVVFLYPWAVLYRQLGMFGLLEMVVFMAILAVGLAYVWRKGALEWE